MALQAGSLIQDQNLNVHCNGVSFEAKGNMNKAQKRAGLAGRKPLGDLSNSVKPILNPTSKRNNCKNFGAIGEETGASKIISNASKKKNISKAAEKEQTSGRKALSDISNSGKPHMNQAEKKNHKKLTVVIKKPINPSASSIAEEQFLHNHQECIKAQMTTMDMDQFIKTVGLNNGFFKHLASPCALPLSSKLKPESPPRYLELEEHPIEDFCLWKHDSPPPCKTPKSPNHHMHWNDYNHIDFMLIGSP